MSGLVLIALRYGVAMLLTVGVYAPPGGDPRASIGCLVALAVACLADREMVDQMVEHNPDMRRARVTAFVTAMNLIAMLLFGLAAAIIARFIQWVTL